MKQLLMALLCLYFFTNCSRSLVYSPSLGLSKQPLAEKQLDIQGGVELMPETRPDQLEGAATTLGFSGRLAYGFSERFTLGVHGWGDLEGRENSFRGGYALQAQLYLARGSDQHFIFIPKAGMAINASTISGYGFEGALVYQKQLNDHLSYFLGGGIAWGIHELAKEENSQQSLRTPMGFGLIGHTGIIWQLTDHLRLNAELNPIYQLNTFDEVAHFMLAPHLGVGYTLNFDD